MIYKYFLQYVASLFIALMMSLSQKVFKFDEAQFITFLLSLFFFLSLRKFCLMKGREDSPRSILMLAPT